MPLSRINFRSQHAGSEQRSFGNTLAEISITGVPRPDEVQDKAAQETNCYICNSGPEREYTACMPRNGLELAEHKRA